ncbi:MAG: DUF3568 family protein [Phycisphaerales bacterium]|nr:DUF3568 family protein [Phycisphaerales bacterium]
MHIIAQSLPIAVCTLIGIAVTGCAPPLLFANAGMSLAAEAGTSAFIEGELRAARKLPMVQVRDAFVQALDNLDFPITGRVDKADYIFLEARQKSGDIVVRLRANSQRVTSISIRVGFLGDQAIARLLMEEVETILKAAATQSSQAP